MSTTTQKIYLVRTYDPYDHEWCIEVATMTLTEAKLAQAKFARDGSQTNILPVKVWRAA